MGGFAFQIACLQLAANEPLFGIYAVPVDWPHSVDVSWKFYVFSSANQLLVSVTAFTPGGRKAGED